MERRTKKMLLAILMIISVLATDFLVLGSGIITYASEFNKETNNKNIEFSAYFKEGENKIDSIDKSIKTEDVKLYAEIKVKNEGYLKEGTVIELENSNFNLKNEISEANTHINSIEGNKINLKQINNGETVELELGIEPIIEDVIKADFLSQTSTVKMLGTYVYSKAEEGQSIRTEKEVCVNYQPEETIAVELEADVITNKVLAVNGENKRIVQLLIKSRVTNNEYPLQETVLKATIPELGEEPEISAIAINELATNGKTEIDYMTTENGVVEIALTNEPKENNETTWKKNAYDEIVITYTYPETVDASKIEITTNSELRLYDSKETILKATSEEKSENEELNNTIIGRIENTTKELYKGKLYTNSNLTYETKTEIAITNPNVVEEVVIHEGADEFGTSEKEIEANTKYESTEINLEKMLEILGQDGNIEIKYGEKRTLVNKESQVNDKGNVVINYEDETAEIDVTTSNPVKAGIIELNHTKTIIGKDYTREQLQQVQNLKTKGTVEGTITVNKEREKVVSNTTEESVVELKETISKAELTIENNKTSLSTTEANEVTLGITLITNGEQYDLYKNPKISLKFPAAVENVELISTPSKQNSDEFTVEVGTFDKTNKTLLIKLQGEQTKYSESELTQSYIQLNLNVTLDQLALGQTDKIMMAYINENAVQYEGGRTDAGREEQEVEISAPSELIKMFNISGNENTSYTETILQRVKESEAGKTQEFGISLINNKDSELSNLKILGKLPTTQNVVNNEKENTLETQLKGITAENATIYYTENTSATEEIENTTNGWTTELLPNAKLYLIKVDSLERGAKLTATVKVQLPNTMTENLISYTQYDVIYDTATDTNTKESSRKIGLATSVKASIKTEVTAQVGQDLISNGDIVKEGEVIRYTVKVSNIGLETLENVQLKLDVPEGTVLLKPRTLQEYKYENNAYFEEIIDSTRIEELTTIQIAKLNTTEDYIIEYEVRINEGTAGKEIVNSPVVIYGDAEVENAEIKNKIQESQLRVTIEWLGDDNSDLVSGGRGRYRVYIENISETTLKNLEMQIISDGMSFEYIDDKEFTGSIKIDEISNKKEDAVEIPENDNGVKTFTIFGKVNKNIEQFNITAIVMNSEGEIYRANLLKEMPKKVDATINISSPQNGQYIEDGQAIEYNILVKNTGEVKSTIKITDAINEYLEVQEVYLNNELKLQKTKETDIINEVYYTVNLKPQEQAKLKIITKAKYIPDLYHGKILTNRASINIENAEERYSEIVTHILKANELQNENLENIISGFAWFDENEDGKRDVNEETLSGIKVKLYDLNTKKYLEDEGGNEIFVTTEQDGQYGFSKINDGSYLVVFEYDTDKYVLTTQLSENVDSSLNSKASIKTITGDTYKARVVAIELKNLKQNALEMNVGLKENVGDVPMEEQPGIEEIPAEPEIPDEPINPEQPTEPDKPIIPDVPTIPEKPNEQEKPGNTEKPEEPIDTKTLSGFAWLDLNGDGRKDKEEKYLSGIKVRIYDINAKEYITNEIITGDDGKYKFSDIEKGSYIVIFEYDTEEYKLSAQNTNVVLKKVNINGQEVTAAVTDTINVQNNITNINIGLKENLKFDLELNKYISKIVVQTNKGTRTYDYEGKTLGKVEIHRKQIQGALVVLEYTIKVKNSGEIAGYAKNIVDYIPSGLTFSSELNTDWYLSGNNLYTKSLENTVINPGEEKEIKIVLTKTMTDENVGLINNRAEIYQDYNKYGESDIDSIPNNQKQNEDDFGTTDVIIQVATGGSTITYIILTFINIVLIVIAIKIMIKNRIIKIKPKKRGGSC